MSWQHWLLTGAEGRGVGGLGCWWCLCVGSCGGTVSEWSCDDLNFVGSVCGACEICGSLLCLSVCRTLLLQAVEVGGSRALGPRWGCVSGLGGVQEHQRIGLNDAFRLVYGVNRHHDFLYRVRGFEGLAAGPQRLPVFILVVIQVKVNPALVRE